MIENWLSILSDEERNIIQLHLIDGKSWKRIEAEYEQKDEYEYRATRTLMRYQQQALKKIEEYVSSMVAQTGSVLSIHKATFVRDNISWS